MKKENRFKKIILYIVASIISIIMIYPFIWMLSSSFKTTGDILSNTLKLIPTEFSFEGYQRIMNIGGLSISKYFFNSVIITVLSVIVTLFITSLGAYSLIRKPKLPGFKVTEMFFLLSIMYPYILLVMPVYVIMHKIGLLGSYTGIILFLSVGPIQFFLLKQFFTKIPYEVIEAAQVDGASEFSILWRIIFPMAVPIFQTVGLITFIFNWSQWFPVMVISTTMDTYTLPVAILNLNSELGIEFPATMALATIVSMPVIILFLLTQNKVMNGIAAGSVKG